MYDTECGAKQLDFCSVVRLIRVYPDIKTIVSAFRVIGFRGRLIFGWNCRYSSTDPLVSSSVRFTCSPANFDLLEP